MEKEKINKIIDKYVEVEFEKSFYFNDISKFNDELMSAFEEFAKTGVLPNFEYKGWNLEKVKQRANTDELGSFIYMDRILKDERYAQIFMDTKRGFIK